MRYNELPKALLSFDEYPKNWDWSEDNGWEFTAMPRNSYLLLLVLRWIMSIHNEQEHSALHYNISWEMGGGHNAHVNANYNVTLFVTITDKRRGTSTKREIAVLERSCHDAVATVQFANGLFGQYRMSGPKGIKHLIREVVHAPRPSLLPYHTRRAFVTVTDTEAGLQLDVVDEGIHPKLHVKLDAFFDGACTAIIVEEL